MEELTSSYQDTPLLINKAIYLSWKALLYLVYIDRRNLSSNMPKPDGCPSQGITGKSHPLHEE